MKKIFSRMFVNALSKVSAAWLSVKLGREALDQLSIAMQEQMKSNVKVVKLSDLKE